MAIVVVAGERPLVEALRAASAGSEIVEVAGLPEAADLVFTRQGEVEAIVLGSSVDDPIQAIQRLHGASADLPLLVVTDEGSRVALTKALQFSPFAGPHVECAPSEPSQIAQRAAEAVRDFRKRRRHRATIAALNTQMGGMGVGSPVAEASQYLSQVLDGAPVGIVATDDAGTIIAWNRHATTLFGKTERETLGLSLREVFPQIEAHWSSLASSSGLPSGKPTVFEESREEGPRFIEVVAAPLTGRGGKRGRLLVLQDVTARKTAERRIAETLRSEKEARAEAEAANHAKDQFLSVMSHELRTPLTAILGWAGLLRRTDAPKEKCLHAAAVIERNGKAQAQLIEDLLDISRITSGQLRLNLGLVDLATVIELAIESARPAADARGVALIVEVRGGLSTLTGDAERLQQVAWNLVSNAVKFTPRGGHVRVTLERKRSQMVLSAEDTGQGIPADFLPYVFDRFRQADSTFTRSRGGLGLGLAISRHIVEVHGGTIAAASAGPGQGSKFTVTLPILPFTDAAQVQAPRPKARSSSVPPPARARLDGVRVLVVDDEPDTSELLSVVLTEAGAKVQAVSDAAAAFVALGQLSPDVVVSDIGMPDEDGLSLVRKIRALPPERGGKTPMIALTAYAAACDRQAILAAGFDAHVAKPMDVASFLDLVHRLRAQ